MGFKHKKFDVAFDPLADQPGGARKDCSVTQRHGLEDPPHGGFSASRDVPNVPYVRFCEKSPVAWHSKYTAIAPSHYSLQTPISNESDHTRISFVANVGLQRIRNDTKQSWPRDADCDIDKSRLRKLIDEVLRYLVAEKIVRVAKRHDCQTRRATLFP